MGTFLPWINFQVAILCLTTSILDKKSFTLPICSSNIMKWITFLFKNAEMSKVNHINSHYWNYKNIVFCTLLIWRKHNMPISWHEWYWNSGSPTFYLFFCFWTIYIPRSIIELHSLDNRLNVYNFMNLNRPSPVQLFLSLIRQHFPILSICANSYGYNTNFPLSSNWCRKSIWMTFLQSLAKKQPTKTQP